MVSKRCDIFLLKRHSWSQEYLVGESVESFMQFAKQCHCDSICMVFSGIEPTEQETNWWEQFLWQ